MDTYLVYLGVRVLGHCIGVFGPWEGRLEHDEIVPRGVRLYARCAGRVD